MRVIVITVAVAFVAVVVFVWRIKLLRALVLGLAVGALAGVIR